MGKVWSAFVAFMQLLWYNITAAIDNLNREKALRSAAENRSAELEEQRAEAIEEALARDIREGTEVLASPNPGAAAGEFLRNSFPVDN